MPAKKSHDVYQFVITGGPCAGKSTCLSVLDNALSDCGIKTIVVPETATEVITSGISPHDLPEKVFQSAIINNAIAKENSARMAAAAYSKTSPVAILYDRGIPDCRAYMSDRNYKSTLKTFGLNDIVVRDRYTAVFHLVSVAVDAPHLYTKANNAARRESVQQAAMQDSKTMQSWVGAQHLRVIDNLGRNFDAKIKKLTDEVFAAIGLPVPIEIENKYLIEMPNKNALGGAGAVKSEILQTYLKPGKSRGAERRVRQRGANGNYSYFYTEKQSIPGYDGRPEYERKISEGEYLQLLLQSNGKSIRKDRYCFVHKAQYFELDVYPQWSDRAILELELTDKNQVIEIPGFIKVLRDVTNDATYKNCALAELFTRRR